MERDDNIITDMAVAWHEGSNDPREIIRRREPNVPDEEGAHLLCNADQSCAGDDID